MDELQALLLEAARLTQEGRIQEAGELLQQAMWGTKASTDRQIPAGAQRRRGSFTNPAGRRDYRLYIPASATAKARPLLVMLHGCGQTPDDFAIGTRMDEHAEQQGFLVLYPAQSTDASPSRCWNWYQPGNQQAGRGEPWLIADLTRQVMAEYSIDPQRVFVVGLSAGGAMAATLAACYPELYSAVGIHSGLAHGAAQDIASATLAVTQGISNPPRPTEAYPPPRPTIVFHGDLDGTVHVANAQGIVNRWLDAAAAHGIRCEAHSAQGEAGGYRYTHSAYGEPCGIVGLEYWQVHGAGHAWLGGAAGGFCTDPRGPDASAEMLRFFLAGGCSPA